VALPPPNIRRAVFGGGAEGGGGALPIQKDTQLQTDLSRNEIIFYIAIVIVIFINMAAAEYGLVTITFAPSLLFLWWFRYYVFPFPPE